jgi:nucleotide-binding universal stress UspA family protein
MNKILVPTDFSENANTALKYAVTLAQESHAEIVLLNVYDIIFPADGTPLMPYAHELMAEESKTMLKNVAEKLIPAEVKCNLISKLGNPVNQIYKTAEDLSIDLIVIGIRGSNKLSQLIIGSTSTSVIRNTNKPVFIIPENTTITPPRKIVFSFDGKQIPSKPTMQPLIEIAETYKAKILTLNVISELELEHLDKRYIAREAFHALKGINYSMNFNQHSDVLEGINDFIETHKVDAVAMIYHPIGFFSRIFMESRAHKMAFYTKKPLLILPEKEI